ncbi:MAG: hypothetical protein SWX82_14100 [Cyanobacteriota bacterium]|nr:hypothetical protein [Cyanobacteriota bacterium]
MAPGTVVTVCMIGTFLTIVTGCWGVFQYISSFENKIKENEIRLTNAAKSLEERDKRLLREMKRHRLCVKDVENFLSKKLEYNIRPSIEMKEDDF